MKWGLYNKRWSVASRMGGKNSITACFRWVQTLKHSPVAALSHKVFWRIFPMGGECSWSPAGVATVQPPSPQPTGSPVWMTSLSRWSEYHFSPQRGGVELEATVNNGSWVGQTASLLLCGWSPALIVGDKRKSFALSLRAWNQPRTEDEVHWGVLLGEGGRRTGGRS